MSHDTSKNSILQRLPQFYSTKEKSLETNNRSKVYCLIVILMPLKNVNVYLYFRLIQMFEGGLIKYWQRRIWPSLRQCDTNNQKSHGPRRLDLDSFKSPFLIWAIGLTLAFIAFLIENLVFIKNSK